jgi:hypothetical protein
MKKDFKELLVEKYFQEWLRENHTLYEDILELHWMLEHIEIMYGVKLNVVYDNEPKEEPKGRELGSNPY